MTINKTKLVAALFIILGSVILIANDLKFTPLVLIFKVIGFGIFMYSIAKQKK
jgi:hypothetical protein